jgi:hypothetical protein
MYLFSDGFDWGAVADLALKWDIVSLASASMVTPANTAFGLGGALNLTATNQLSKNLPSNEDTIYVNLRRKQTQTASGGYFFVSLSDGATVQCTLRWNESGTLAVYSGNGTTLLGSVDTAFAQGVWDSWQAKVVVHNTAGSIEIRKNGSPTPVLSVSGVNTRGGTTNNYVNRVNLGTSSTGSNEQIDDVFACSGSGAAPNSWPGDLRAVSLLPAADVDVDFSRNLATAQQIIGLTASAISIAANILHLEQFTATFSGTITQLTASLSGAVVGSMNMALYAADGPSGSAGTLLAQSTSKGNPGIGSHVFVLAAPVPVVKGTRYYVARLSSGTMPLQASASASTVQPTATLAQSYSSGFPATAGANSPGSAQQVYSAMDYTISTNAAVVQDDTLDNDSSYVFADTMGAQDLYSLSPMPVNPASIALVVPFMIARKTDSGTRTAALMLKSDDTEVEVVASSALGQTYGYLGAPLMVDPDSGNPWTKALVDALQIGPKITL